MEYKIDMSLPGYQTEKDIQTFLDLAMAVPKGGCIVEVGPGQGILTQNLALNLDPSIQIFAIDIWHDEKIMGKSENQCPNTVESFMEKLGWAQNVHAIRSWSPPSKWSAPVDMVIIDVHHRRNYWLENILFWSRFLVPGGIMVGTDMVVASNFEADGALAEEFKDRLVILDALISASDKLERKLVRHPNCMVWQLV